MFAKAHTPAPHPVGRTNQPPLGGPCCTFHRQGHKISNSRLEVKKKDGGFCPNCAVRFGGRSHLAGIAIVFRAAACCMPSGASANRRRRSGHAHWVQASWCNAPIAAGPQDCLRASSPTKRLDMSRQGKCPRNWQTRGHSDGPSRSLGGASLALLLTPGALCSDIVGVHGFAELACMRERGMFLSRPSSWTEGPFPKRRPSPLRSHVQHLSRRRCILPRTLRGLGYTNEGPPARRCAGDSPVASHECAGHTPCRWPAEEAPTRPSVAGN